MGAYRFLRRTWELVSENRDIVLESEEDSREVLRAMHKAIKRVGEDIEKLKFNTAVSGLMIYLNTLEKKAKTIRKSGGRIGCAEWDDALRTLLLLLAPFAPYMAEELWQQINTKTKEQKYKKTVSRSLGFSVSWSIHLQPWPSFDPGLAEEEVIEIPIQVNGRLRGTVVLERSQASDRKAVEEKAREVESVIKYLKGGETKKVIFVPTRLINFLV